MKPHDGVFARIQPSRIHGVGVFAVRNIKNGAYILPDDKVKIVWVSGARSKDSQGEGESFAIPLKNRATEFAGGRVKKTGLNFGSALFVFRLVCPHFSTAPRD